MNPKSVQLKLLSFQYREGICQVEVMAHTSLQEVHFQNKKEEEYQSKSPLIPRRRIAKAKAKAKAKARHIPIDANCWHSNLPPPRSLIQNCSISFQASSTRCTASCSGRAPDRYINSVDRQRLMQIVRWPVFMCVSKSAIA